MKKIILFVGLALILLFSVNSFGQTCISMPDVFSPMSQELAENIRAIVQNNPNRNPAVFMIVGDSISGDGGAGSYYMGNCSFPYGSHFSSYGWIDIKDLFCYPDLSDSLDFFMTGTLSGGTNSFTRNSIAAYPGRTASWATTGNPSPLQREINAINPQYALIMFGSNDIYGIDVNETWLIEEIVDDLLLIADSCADQGVVPILKSAPNKVGYSEQMFILSEYIRLAAEERQYPFIDVLAATWPLPNHGQGSDGTHFRYYDYNRMCVFHTEALNYGINMHNLITLQMLDDLYRIVELNEECIDCEVVPEDTDSEVTDTGEATDVDTGSVADSESESTYVNPCNGAGHDLDLDGICSCEDNCPVIYNPLQEDNDSDSMGNVCDC
jgi:hypothetical protein